MTSQKIEVDIDWVREHAPKTLQIKYLDNVFGLVVNDSNFQLCLDSGEKKEKPIQVLQFSFRSAANRAVVKGDSTKVSSIPSYTGYIDKSNKSHLIITVPTIGFIFEQTGVDRLFGPDSKQHIKQELFTIVKFLKENYNSSFEIQAEINHDHKYVKIQSRSETKKIDIIFNAQATPIKKENWTMIYNEVKSIPLVVRAVTKPPAVGEDARLDTPHFKSPVANSFSNFCSTRIKQFPLQSQDCDWHPQDFQILEESNYFPDTLNENNNMPTFGEELITSIKNKSEDERGIQTGGILPDECQRTTTLNFEPKYKFFAEPRVGSKA